MPTPTAADLVEALADLRLLDAAQLDKVHRAMKGRAPDPKAVARELLKRGWLTAFQADLLLQGRGDDLVLGPYVLLDRLGEGAMGRVFKARHRIMGRTVAVKVIRKELLAHPDAVQRFHREIQVAAQLDHPHLIRAHDASQVGDTHFLVMEYAGGIDLQRLVQESGPLPVGQACEYIRQAALGLQHAHERGLVHRDVKPSNLQVTAQGTAVKILDMGLARSQAAGCNTAAGLTQARTMMGTPDYIAPEQIADASRVDIRADVYSLGCTLYFLLAGRPPYPVEAWEEKLVCHKRVEPQLIEQLRPDVPAAVGAVLRKMTAKRPEDRYAAPAAVAEALAPFCAMTGPAPAVGAAGSIAPASLGSHPAAGYEPGWTLKAASTVGLPLAAPATSMPVASQFSAPTMLVTGRPPASEVLPVAYPARPAPEAGKRFALVVAGSGAALGLLVLLLILVWPRGGADKKGDNQAAKDAGAQGQADADSSPPIDEDFRTAFKQGLNVPEGWTEGDAFRIDKVNDEPFLEVRTLTGTPFVTLPPVKRSGNFYIEGVSHLGPLHRLTIRLENRKINELLPVVIDYTGAILIADDLTKPLSTYKPGLPTKFLLARKGSHLSVSLNGRVAANKEMGPVTEFVTVKLGLTAGRQYQGRLFRLRVGALGVDGAVPPSNMSVPDVSVLPKKKKGKKGG